jgi:hypothetical protein
MRFASSGLLKIETAVWPESQTETHDGALSFGVRHRGGGGERDRTDDLLLAKQALSQLSYTPDAALVGLVGFEPTTPALSRRCSNRLSYRPFAYRRNQADATRARARRRT